MPACKRSAGWRQVLTRLLPRAARGVLLGAAVALAGQQALAQGDVQPATAPGAPAPLTVVSWGGAYEAAQRRAIFAPFARATGIELRILRYDGGLDSLRRRAGPEGWDIIDMLEPTAISACEAGLLAPLDATRVLDANARTLRGDFAQARLRRCAIPQNVFATVMAYDDRAFPGVKPTRIEDFFDVERFPGKRAIAKSPDGILEWALLAEGVPPEQVYDLLSTARGLKLAFRRLERLRGHVLWWQDAADPPRLLSSGQAVMASGYNGRFFTAARLQGAPIDVIWDGRIIGHDVWAVVAGTDRPDAARRFLAYALHPDRMARLAERIPYGPARRSAMARIGLHPDTGIPMRAHLPNAPQHGARRLVRDGDWYSHTRAIRQRRFEAWLQRGSAGSETDTP